MTSEHFKLGLNKAKLGLHVEAIEEFEKAAWEDPNNFEIQYNLGTAFLTLGGFDQAIISFSNALKIYLHFIKYSISVISMLELGLLTYQICLIVLSKEI